MTTVASQGPAGHPTIRAVSNLRQTRGPGPARMAPDGGRSATLSPALLRPGVSGEHLFVNLITRSPRHCLNGRPFSYESDDGPECAGDHDLRKPGGMSSAYGWCGTAAPLSERPARTSAHGPRACPTRVGYSHGETFDQRA